MFWVWERCCGEVERLVKDCFSLCFLVLLCFFFWFDVFVLLDVVLFLFVSFLVGLEAAPFLLLVAGVFDILKKCGVGN